MHLTG